MSIIFNHVHKRIGKNNVIQDINCEIKSGTITGLKGINGSGKTMMMRLIAGLIYPTSGEVSIDDKVLGRDISFPDSLGLMLENPAFLNTYTGYDNLKILAGIKNTISSESIYSVLERVGLNENGKKKYKKYSLGMKQRLGLAAAIMESPNILLLDEPTNALDSDGVEMVKKIVREEKDRGATIIISCHDSDILDSLADEVFVLEAGTITNFYTPNKQDSEGVENTL